MNKTITLYLNGERPEEKIELSPVKIDATKERIDIEGIPENHSLEYLAKDAYDDFYVVHRPSENWNFSDFRLHIGKGRKFIEAKVVSVSRAKDGGTTIINYMQNIHKGRLYFPSPLKPTEHAYVSHYNSDTVLGLMNLLKDYKP